MTPQIIEDLMTSAFEGGSNHWLSAAHAVSPTVPKGRRFYGVREFWEADWVIRLTYDDPQNPDADATQEITRDQCQKTWDRLCLERTDLIKNFRYEEADAEDADEFLQELVFGKVVYG